VRQVPDGGGFVDEDRFETGITVPKEPIVPSCDYNVEIEGFGEIQHQICSIVPDGEIHSFWMGIGEDVLCDLDWSIEMFPRHQASLSGYSMSRLPVTAQEYEQCVLAGACTVPDLDQCLAPFGPIGEDPEFQYQSTYDNVDKQDHPMNCVTKAQASAFCEWLGGSLPSDAQYEYGMVGPTPDQNAPKLYPWGDEAVNCYGNFDDYADPWPNTSPVGFYDGELKDKSDYDWPKPMGTYQTCDDSSVFGLKDTNHNVLAHIQDGPNAYSDWPPNPLDPVMPGYCADCLLARGSGYWFPILMNYQRHFVTYETAMQSFGVWFGEDTSFTFLGFRCAFPPVE